MTQYSATPITRGLGAKDLTCESLLKLAEHSAKEDGHKHLQHRYLMIKVCVCVCVYIYVYIRM